MVAFITLLVWTGQRPAGADTAGLVARADPRLFDQLERLASRRIVCFAGLPGTGKSLLAHQLAHLAHARGRVVHLLQWDVARPAIEASDAGRRYPVRDGVSHAVVRMAAGLWARDAVAGWIARTGPEHLLIGETPFVGHRFIELARRSDDAAEPLLSAPSCRFVIPVPSREVRTFLETERERRTVHPLHAQESEDAPPQVLRDLWQALVEVARTLGLASDAPASSDGGLLPHGRAAEAPYDPLVYRRVYERLLRHRHTDVVPLDRILPTEALSVYDFAVPRQELAPSPAEAARVVRDVEERYPDVARLERETARWWDV
jgi:DNA polymerase III delta prime subunit